MKTVTDPVTLRPQGVPRAVSERRLLAAADILTTWGTIEREQSSGQARLAVANRIRAFIEERRPDTVKAEAEG